MGKISFCRFFREKSTVPYPLFTSPLALTSALPSPGRYHKSILLFRDIVIQIRFIKIEIKPLLAEKKVG